MTGSRGTILSIWDFFSMSEEALRGFQGISGLLKGILRGPRSISENHREFQGIQEVLRALRVAKGVSGVFQKHQARFEVWKVGKEEYVSGVLLGVFQRFSVGTRRIQRVQGSLSGTSGGLRRDTGNIMGIFRFRRSQRIFGGLTGFQQSSREPLGISHC